MVTDLEFQLRRPAILLYSVLGLCLSSALLLLCLRRGLGEFFLWLIAYAGLGLLSLARPQASPLAAGALAFLLGFARTHRGGYNLDLGLGLIALAVGLHTLGLARNTKRDPAIDLAGMSLYAISVWSLVSLAFAAFRIRTFAAAPGFAYRTYQFNSFGLSSDEALVRAMIGATATFVWFGLYLYARSSEPGRNTLNTLVFLVLLVNAAALFVQGHLDPGFLRPAGTPLAGRLNGVTSFSYALGDAVLCLFLLLPAWGVTRGPLAVLTAGSIGLGAYAVVASGSRTAFFTILLATVAWGGLRAVRLGRVRRRAAALVSLAAVALLACAVTVAYLLTPADQVTPLGRLRDGVERQGWFGHLSATRLSSYPLAFRVMLAYPLSGVGAGLYLAEVGKQHALLTPQLKIEESYLLGSYAPNEFLNTGVELGLPAMVALVAVFVAVLASLFRRRPEGWGELAVSLVALAGALQLGPALYNSEALVFAWLIIGSAARLGSEAGTATPQHPDARKVGPRVTGALVAAVFIVGVGGHLLALKPLAVDQQWKRLRWRLAMGMLAPEPGGRWTRPEATFVVDTDAPGVIVRWHTGDPAMPDRRTEVSFYVDGALAARAVAVPGRTQDTLLPLPSVAGFKRISVRVVPPFVPGASSTGKDHRDLGIFVHSTVPWGVKAGQAFARTRS